MRTIVKVHTPEERLAARMAGERRTERCLIRLVATVSILRTLLTRVLPLAGSAGWWMTLVCFLPGLAVYGLLLLLMHLTKTAVLTDALRFCFGRFGAWLLAAVLAALLLLDGASSMTALITLFTEGIGTEGTQFTLALLTGAVLCFCLHRDGLPRGVFFLRWLMLGALAAMAFDWLGMSRLDGLFPLLGDGVPSLIAALEAGASLAWPLVLLLTAEPVRPGVRIRPVLPVLLLCLGVVLLTCLSLPHELLVTHHDLSGSLLEMTLHLQPAVRMLAICLLLLTLFLTLGGTAHLITGALAAPVGRGHAWLPYAAVALLVLSQLMDIRALWTFLSASEPWLLAPLTALAVAALPAALVKRRRA